MRISDILLTDNIAEELDEEQLKEIGSSLQDGYKIDCDSREGWTEKTEDYIRLATQVVEEKNFPWPNASNMKYPMLTTAAIQFSSRAYPGLIQGNNPIKAVVTGYDISGRKMDQADRIGKHLSYQVMHEMEEWEQDMDRLLMVLPIVGTAFKKTYFCPTKGRNVSEYVSPLDFVVNYHAKTVETANRKFHKISYYKNEVVEKIRSGFYKDFDLEGQTPTVDPVRLDEETQGLSPVASDEDAPYEFLEAHVYLDLDEDDYKEPYIVTLLERSGDVVRIVPRFSERSVEFNDKNEVAKITPDEYFTGYTFIPDPVSNIYGLGFGNLLGPLNDTTNTIINQLIDAGTLSNTGGGFLGRGFKLRNMGEVRFKPGEWKATQSSGEDLRKSIFPLPVREPSGTLFSLLGTIIDSGQRLSSTMDIMMGESPGQNQPATTTMAVLEQGLKVYTSIHKRVYRSLKQELNKLFKLNARYMNPEEYFRVLDEQTAPPPPPQQEQPPMPGQPPMQGQPPQGMPGMGPQAPQPQNNIQVGQNDYLENLDSLDVTLAGDPNVVTQSQKLLKAEALMALASSGAPLNMQEVIVRVLEAQEQPNIQALLDAPPPQPDPKVVLEQEKFKHQQMIDTEKLRLDEQRVASEAVKDESQGLFQRVKAEATVKEASMKELQSEVDAIKTLVESKKVAQTPIATPNSGGNNGSGVVRQ